MSHYWTAHDDPALRKLQALDWVEDLAQFDAEVVAEACRMWRRANNRRPTPHDIRGLCIAEAEYRRPIPIPSPPTPAEVAQQQELYNIRKWRWQLAAAYRWMQTQGLPMPSGIPEDSPINHELLEYFERAEKPPPEFIARLPEPQDVGHADLELRRINEIIEEQERNARP